MKILLINPWEVDVLPPPSIGYLQAALKHWNIDVISRDLSEVLALNDDFDIVGVSFHSFSIKFARAIRDKFKSHLICGGHHPSAMPEQMIKIGYDQVVVGEGENAIIDIVLAGNNAKIVKDCDQKYFNSIDDIPFPDYTGLHFTGELGINIITSRGCPFNCNFCGSSIFWGHKYKMRTAENVIAEIEQRKSEGFSSWFFEDDNFLVDKKRVYEICSNLDGSLYWGCQGRAESLEKDLCHELYRAGCRQILLGIESLSQDALDRCNKNTTVEKMLKGIEAAVDENLNILSMFIVGLPGDTIKNIEETNLNRKNSKITNYVCSIAWVLPGTNIYNKAKEYGFDDNIYLETGAPFYTYEQPIEILEQWKNGI